MFHEQWVGGAVSAQGENGTPQPAKTGARIDPRGKYAALRYAQRKEKSIRYELMILLGRSCVFSITIGNSLDHVLLHRQHPFLLWVSAPIQGVKRAVQTAVEEEGG